MIANCLDVPIFGDWKVSFQW